MFTDYTVIDKQANALIKKLKNSPKFNTYENYGQKEIRKFLDGVKDYSEQGRALELFNKAGF